MLVGKWVSVTLEYREMMAVGEIIDEGNGGVLVRLHDELPQLYILVSLRQILHDEILYDSLADLLLVIEQKTKFKVLKLVPKGDDNGRR